MRPKLEERAINRSRSKVNFSSLYQNTVRYTGDEKKAKLDRVANSDLDELADS